MLFSIASIALDCPPRLSFHLLCALCCVCVCVCGVHRALTNGIQIRMRIRINGAEGRMTGASEEHPSVRHLHPAMRSTGSPPSCGCLQVARECWMTSSETISFAQWCKKKRCLCRERVRDPNAFPVGPVGRSPPLASTPSSSSCPLSPHSFFSYPCCIRAKKLILISHSKLVSHFLLFRTLSLSLSFCSIRFFPSFSFSHSRTLALASPLSLSPG